MTAVHILLPTVWLQPANGAGTRSQKTHATYLSDTKLDPELESCQLAAGQLTSPEWRPLADSTDLRGHGFRV